jgi:hypothetical protein
MPPFREKTSIHATSLHQHTPYMHGGLTSREPSPNRQPLLFVKTIEEKASSYGQGLTQPYDTSSGDTYVWFI